MLKVRRPIVNFFVLILGVLLNFTLDNVYPPKHWSYQDSSKGNFEFKLRQGLFDCLVFPTFKLVSTKADPTTKKQSCKRGMVRAAIAGHMYESDLYTSCWPAGLGRLSWVWKNKCMQNLSSSEGLTQYSWRMLWWGVDYLYCSVRESLVWRSPKKHWNHCVWLTVGFCESEMLSLRSRVW